MLSPEISKLGSDASFSANAVGRTFWRFAVPSIIAMLVSGLYQVIDGVFVGYFVGESGLAGINLALPMLSVVIGFGLLVGMGGGSVLSNFRGKNNETAVNETLGTSMYLMLFGGLILGIVLSVLGGTMLHLQGGDNPPGEEYLALMSYGCVITIGATALPILIRNDNKPTLATLFIVFGALINIALDYMLIGLYGLGLEGAAMATLIAQVITCILCVGYFLRASRNIFVRLSAFNGRIALRVMQLGASGLVMFIYFGFTLSIHNTQLASYGGLTHVAAFSIVGYIASLYYFFAEGLAGGTQPPVSFYNGAKQYHKTLQTLTLATSVIIISGIAMVVVLNLFPTVFVGLFTHEQGLMAVAAKGLRLHLFTLYLDGLFFLVAIYFIAVEKAGAAMFVSLGNMLIQLPFLWFLPRQLGVEGVWLAVPLSNVVFACAVIPIFLHSIYKVKLSSDLQTV